MTSRSLESSDKLLLLSAFNTQFFDFVTDIELVFSEDTSIKKAKMALNMIKKVNPALIIKIWYTYVCSQYENEIHNDNINFLELHTLSCSNGCEFVNNDDNIYLDNIIKSKYNFNIKK